MKDQLKENNEDYLWDRSGDSEVEIRDLENLLGTFRSRPGRLAIPAELQISRPVFLRSGSRLAIAATILLAIAAGALWLTLGTNNESANNESLKAAVTVPDDVLKEIPSAGAEPVPTIVLPDSAAVTIAPAPRSVRRNRVNQAASSNRLRVAGPVAPMLAARRRRDAEAGKARLMLALRYASAKLNVALKKSQGPNNRNLINNQHRIG